MRDYTVLIYQPSRGDENWRLVIPDLDGRTGAVAELVRQAMRIDDGSAVELLQAVLDGRYDVEAPIRMGADDDAAWLCICRNAVGVAEPPLPQMDTQRA